MSGITFRRIEANGVTLNCAFAGDPESPLIVCLHGFPEYWAGWRAVMRRLAESFHVVVPDQRGYNLSDKPGSVSAYRTRNMVADLAAIAERLSPGRPFALAGHDWGASVAYAYAFAHPDRLSHLVIANGVHPVCFQRAIFEDEEQRLASQYINRLRADDAEELLSGDGHARLLRMLEKFSDASWMSTTERAGYLEAWSRPGALSAMLNWYRASPIRVPVPGETADVKGTVLEVPADAVTVHVPHLLVWGEEDAALRPSCIEGLERFSPKLTVRRVAGAGHWILHERPEEVAAAMCSFVERRM